MKSESNFGNLDSDVIVGGLQKEQKDLLTIALLIPPAIQCKAPTKYQI